MRDLRNQATLLIADDDPEDLMLTRDALADNKMSPDVRTVSDGEELLAYLRQSGRYAAPGAAPRPALILLDLNMPKLDGREALREMKADPRLRDIPVVIFSSSKAEEDVCRTYDLGGSSFISKPVSYDRLLEVIRMLGMYWFKTVELPTRDTRTSS